MCGRDENLLKFFVRLPQGKAPVFVSRRLRLQPIWAAGYAIAIASGDYHVCAVLLGGSVACWGYNAHGELGVDSMSSIGLAAGQMGSNLQPSILGGPDAELSCLQRKRQFFSLMVWSESSGRKAVGISAGSSFTCALLVTGDVVCWGFNGDGSLGVGSTANIGWGSGQMETDLVDVDLAGWSMFPNFPIQDSNDCKALDSAYKILVPDKYLLQDGWGKGDAWLAVIVSCMSKKET